MEQTEWSKRNINEPETFTRSRKRKRKQEWKKQKKLKSEKDKNDCGSNNGTTVPSSKDKSEHSKDLKSLKTSCKGCDKEGSSHTKQTKRQKLCRDNNIKETKKILKGEIKATKTKGENESRKGTSCSKNVSNDKQSGLSFKNARKSCDLKQGSAEIKNKVVKEMSELHDQKQNGITIRQNRKNVKDYDRQNYPKSKKQRNMKNNRQNNYQQNKTKTQNCRSKHYTSELSASLIDKGADRTGREEKNDDADECLDILLYKKLLILYNLHDNICESLKS